MRPTVRAPGRLAGVAIAIVLALGMPAGAGATQSTTLPPDAGLAVSVQPSSGRPLSYFDTVAHAGRADLAGALRLVNHGDRPIQVELAPVPALTLSTLGSGYGSTSPVTGGDTSWVHLSSQLVRLAPHASDVVQVSTLPPGSVKAGDYLAGVSIEALGQTTGQSDVQNGMAISDLRRYAIGVETRVPGPRHPLLALTHASVRWEPSGLTFYVRGVNRGNVILTGVHGTVSISTGGHRVAQMPVGPGTFVTRSSIEIPLLAQRERPRVGTLYGVRARLVYDGGVAILDTTVRFGHAAAVIAHNYQPDTMPVPGGFSMPAWLATLLGVSGTLIVLAVGYMLLVAGRRRREDAGVRRFSARTNSGRPSPKTGGIVLRPPPVNGDSPVNRNGALNGNGAVNGNSAANGSGTANGYSVVNGHRPASGNSGGPEAHPEQTEQPAGGAAGPKS